LRDAKMASVTKTIDELTRDELTHLAREYFLAGHLIDRAGMPQVMARLGNDAMTAVAIDEWMGASPVYTRRMQRALNISGDDVATIFKGIQFDIGAPHQFMDFQYSVEDADHGEFWLASCGALMDVEPMGEPFVQAMCHDIEDPTFDATAVATNPRARMRPIHRPPRHPADRHPHCHWRVDIVHDAEPLQPIDNMHVVAKSHAANVTIETKKTNEPGGLTDYSGPLVPELEMEDLSRDTLLTVALEACVQAHLLVRAFMLTVEQRSDPDTARAIADQQFTGVAGVVAARLARLLGHADGSLDTIARVFEFHPAFHPRAYVDFAVERRDDAVRLALRPCLALDEGDERSWFALLGAGPHPAFQAIAHAVDRQAQVRAATPTDDERFAWEVVVDPTATPAKEAPEVSVTRVSTGADFVFRRRRPIAP
jgi:hypothetical protein